MNKNGNSKSSKTPAFALKAERAHQRVARKVKAASRKDRIPIIGWKNGKVVEKVF